MEPTFAAAKPGRGHRALASLYRAGMIPAIVTQNIDNLHQASGFAADHVVELHGNTTYARCIGCGRAYDLSWVSSDSTRTAAPPTAPYATSRSRPRPFRSGKRCPKMRWRARTSLSHIA